MSNINNIAIVLSNNARARAYLHIMMQDSIKPSHAILLEENDVVKSMSIKKTSLFDNETSVEDILINNKIPYVKLNTQNINDPSCIFEISKLNQEYIIFAGNPGNILSSKCFQYNKKFIHIHPGKLPEYKGSTVFYYSILNENKISMTAIFMSEIVDKGDIIDEITYDLSSEIFFDKADLDNILEPYLRSVLLKKILLNYCKDGVFKSRPQTESNINEEQDGYYYIVHPLLRHICILKNDNFNQG